MAVSAVREFKEGPSSADVLIVFRVGGPLKKGLRRVLLGAGGPPEVQRGPLRVDKKELKVYVLCECKQKRKSSNKHTGGWGAPPPPTPDWVPTSWGP